MILIFIKNHLDYGERNKFNQWCKFTTGNEYILLRKVLINKALDVYSSFLKKGICIFIYHISINEKNVGFVLTYKYYFNTLQHWPFAGSGTTERGPQRTDCTTLMTLCNNGVKNVYIINILNGDGYKIILICKTKYVTKDR